MCRGYRRRAGGTVENCKSEDQFVITKTCPCMIIQEMPSSGCTLWPVYVRKKSLTVYSPRPAFGGAADTSAVVGSIMYDKWPSTRVESSQRKLWIAIFTLPSNASKHDKLNLLDADDQCTDDNIIGVSYGFDSNICQDQSMGDIGALTMLTEDCGHSRMIMPVMLQDMILMDNIVTKSWIKSRTI